MDVIDKLKVLADAAKYDVSCSSSGSNRNNKKVDWVMPVLLVFAIVGLMMADVYPCLKYLCPIIASLIVPIA